MGFREALRPYWHPVTRSESVQEDPVSITLLDEQVVLFRSEGEVVAFEDKCIHRGAQLSLGKKYGENLECPYHGFQFGRDGRCVRIPSMSADQPIPEKARVRKYHAKEQYGAIWVALDEPEYDVFPFPEYDDSAFHTFLMGPMDWEASAPRVIENNYDYTHTAFLHEGRLGSRELTEIPPIPPEDRVGNEYRYVLENVEPNWAKVHQPGGVAKKRIRYYNRLILPLCTHSRIHDIVDDKESDDAYLFVMAVSPTSEKKSRTWLWVSRNYGFDIPDLEFERWEANTLAQDRLILESQRPELIPTDLKEELLLPNETHHVQYRRWLASIGIE